MFNFLKTLFNNNLKRNEDRIGALKKFDESTHPVNEKKNRFLGKMLRNQQLEKDDYAQTEEELTLFLSDNTAIFKEYSDSVHDAIYRMHKDKFAKCIVSASEFNKIMCYLTPEERLEMYDQFKTKLLLFINNATDFALVIQYLDDKQRTTIYLQCKDRLPQLVVRSYHFAAIMLYLNAVNRFDFYLKCKDRFSFTRPIQDRDDKPKPLIFIPIYRLGDISNILPYLDENSSILFLDTALKEIGADLTVENALELDEWLQPLTILQRKKIYEVLILRNQLSKIFKNPSDFDKVLTYLDDKHKKIFFQNIIIDLHAYADIESKFNDKSAEALSKILVSSLKYRDDPLNIQKLLDEVNQFLIDQFNFAEEKKISFRDFFVSLYETKKLNMYGCAQMILATMLNENHDFRLIHKCLNVEVMNRLKQIDDACSYFMVTLGYTMKDILNTPIGIEERNELLQGLVENENCRRYASDYLGFVYKQKLTRIAQFKKCLLKDLVNDVDYFYSEPNRLANIKFLFPVEPEMKHTVLLILSELKREFKKIIMSSCPDIDITDIDTKLDNLIHKIEMTYIPDKTLLVQLITEHKVMLKPNTERVVDKDSLNVIKITHTRLEESLNVLSKMIMDELDNIYLYCHRHYIFFALRDIENPLDAYIPTLKIS